MCPQRKTNLGFFMYRPLILAALHTFVLGFVFSLSPDSSRGVDWSTTLYVTHSHLSSFACCACVAKREQFLGRGRPVARPQGHRPADSNGKGERRPRSGSLPSRRVNDRQLLPARPVAQRIVGVRWHT